MEVLVLDANNHVGSHPCGKARSIRAASTCGTDRANGKDCSPKLGGDSRQSRNLQR
jgi:hypothetical protein